MNCGVPGAPVNGSLGSYPHTREGASVTYQCDVGFRPSIVFTAVCGSNKVWMLNPADHVCTFVDGILYLGSNNFRTTCFARSYPLIWYS